LLPADQNPSLAQQSISLYEELKTFVPDRPGHDRRYAIDASRIANGLGWKPKHNFESGLAKTVDWYLNNREWCATVVADKYSRERLGLAAK
jgi:dTDP-glucose 4,6-dehydratase